MNEYLHYFAYGSNLHPVRLSARLPYCRFIHTASLQGYQLRFHQIGQDTSAKCDAWYTGDLQDRVYGAIFEIRREDRAILDRCESLGDGYEIVQMQMDVIDSTCDVFLYQAMAAHIDEALLPFDWYRELVLLGAEYHGFPKAYCEAIGTVDSVCDEDITRNHQAERILWKMR